MKAENLSDLFALVSPKPGTVKGSGNMSQIRGMMDDKTKALPLPRSLLWLQGRGLLLAAPTACLPGPVEHTFSPCLFLYLQLDREPP